MRYIIGASAIGIATLLICLAIAVCIAQPKAHAQLRNPYRPFTVETSVRDL